MKTLKYIVQENFKFKINRDTDIYIHHPKTWNELRQIIDERFKELGPGTKSNPINFNDIDVSEMTTFYDESSIKGIFEETKFEYIDVSDWNVSNITNMCYLFFNGTRLKSIGDLSNWNVSNVENIRYMFGYCYKLKSVGNLSKWDVSHVKYMDNIFFSSGITNKPNWYEE